MLFLHVALPALRSKNLLPEGAGQGRVSLWTDVCHHPPQLLASEIKQFFLSTNLACLLLLSDEQSDPTDSSFANSRVACCLVTKLCPTFATPWTVACQAPLSMGFSRQEYCSGFADSFALGSIFLFSISVGIA